MTEEINATIEVPQAINGSGLDVAIENPTVVAPPNAPLNLMRTIFRFKGAQDMSIDLGKIYKIVYQEGSKAILLQVSPKKDDLADSIEFESEDAALRGYEQIIGIWARGS